MKVTVDGREVERLEKSIGRAAGAAEKDAQAIVAKGALNIKKDAQRVARSFRRAPLYWSTINYDVRSRSGVIAADIGPDKTKRVGGGPHRTPGNLGGLLEYGSVNNPPHPHLRPAAARELPRFEKALRDAASRALEER